MARHFTLTEARQALPEVERLLRDALFHKAEYQSAHGELQAATERIRFSGGARVNPMLMRSAKARRDQSVNGLRRALEAIGETGAQVKDLDIGLIDFLSYYQDREVCLCWKLGEEGIHFWHGSDEGFRGRKPIDEDFLTRHHGDPAQ